MLLTDEEKLLIFNTVSTDLRGKRFISAKVHIQELVQEKLSNDEAENLNMLKDFIQFAREQQSRLVIFASIFALNKYISKNDAINSDSVKFIVDCAHAIWGKSLVHINSNPNELLSIVSEKIDYPYGANSESHKPPKPKN